MEEEKPQITTPEMVVVLLYAILFDALGLIPGLGTVVAILGMCTIGVWGWIRLGKIPLNKKLKKYLAKRVLIFIIEVLPIAQIFPGWTVMALLGFRGASIAGTSSKALFLAIASASLLYGKRAFALEVTYPSFFPLREGVQLNELLQIIFTSTLTIGAILAFISLIYIGFEYIVSGDSGQKRSIARKHVTATALAVTILLASVVSIRLINPNLVTIPPLIVDALQIEAPEIVPGQDPSTEELGGNFSRLRLADNLNSLNDFLEEIGGENSSLLEEIAELSEECSSDLCTPGSLQYSKEETFDCSYEECWSDGEEEFCEIIPATCQRCTEATCDGSNSSCSGDPLPEQPTLVETIEEALEQFEELTALTGSVSTQRARIASCGEGVISCVSARAFGLNTSCDAAEDFFCGATSSPTSSLLLRELAEKEEIFANSIRDISERVLSATCANTLFSCSGGSCGFVSGQCRPSESDGASGCPPELFEKADTLRQIGENISTQQKELAFFIETADSTLEVSSQSAGGLLLRTCAEARAAVNDLREAGIYSNGTCATETSCCPTRTVVEALESCDPVDLFICS